MGARFFVNQIVKDQVSKPLKLRLTRVFCFVFDSKVGSVGFEPTPDGLKVRDAASYTTTPIWSVANWRLEIKVVDRIRISLVQWCCVVSGNPENRTQHALDISQR